MQTITTTTITTTIKDIDTATATRTASVFVLMFVDVADTKFPTKSEKKNSFVHMNEITKNSRHVIPLCLNIPRGWEVCHPSAFSYTNYDSECKKSIFCYLFLGMEDLIPASGISEQSCGIIS